MTDLPPLPERHRGFFCTKCHGSECVPETLKDEHPLCRCGYLGFAQDLDFTADQMQAFAEAAIKQEREAANRDAERYRHMRNTAVFRDRNGPGLYWYLPRFMRGSAGERLDEAIDDAIRARSDPMHEFDEQIGDEP